MARGGKCPNCGEPVSPFAAGCAICGADLTDYHRAVAARAARPGLPTGRLPRIDDDTGVLLLVGVLVLAMPVAGLIVALLAMRDPGRANVRWILIAMAAIAVSMLVTPLRYGVFWLLG